MQVWQVGDVLKHRQDAMATYRVVEVENGNTAIFITGERPEFVCGCVYKMWNETLGVTLIASENNPVLDDFVFLRREPVGG